MTIEASGKTIKVMCSASARKALARRDLPLVAEIELAFACFTRKQVLFHDNHDNNHVINVNEKLALRITTIIPHACELAAEPKIGTRATPINFMPKWVRIDHANGKWAGEYGL